MSSRPQIHTQLLAQILEALPGRHKKRLDKSPQTAEGWAWRHEAAQTLVETDTGERVQLSVSPLYALEQVSCSCLLSPKCFHIAAVTSLLPVTSEGPAAAEGSAAEAAAEDRAGGEGRDAAAPEEHTKPQAAAPTEAQQQLAAQVFDLASQVLQAGLSATSALRTAQLLRFSFEARRQHLPTLERLLIRVFEVIRQLTSGSADFRLSSATQSLGALLSVAHQLGRGEPEAIGTARARYEAAAGLRLTGLFTEPIFSGGQAGAVSYFSDGEQIYSSGDVMPGEISRVVHAYESPLRFGEVTLAQREACRQGLIFASATISETGRLGVGKAVQVVTTKSDPAMIDRLFAQPISAQLTHAASRQSLLFLEGRFELSPSGPVFVCPGLGAMALHIELDGPGLYAHENIQVLARAGVASRLVGRVLPTSVRILSPLALFEGGTDLPDAQAFPYKPEEQGRINLAFDRVDSGRFSQLLGEQAFLERQEAQPQQTQVHIPQPPTQILHRRLERCVLAGRNSLVGIAHEALGHDLQQLETAYLKGAAQLLRGLSDSAQRGQRLKMAEVFLAAHIYVQAADRAYQHAAWGAV